MNRVMTPEKKAALERKREKEIAKWEKQRARPRVNLYFLYLALIICIIYATDEIASQIGTLMKTEIANDLFRSDSSVTLLNILTVIGVPFQALGLLYRPLADRYGRKLFLIINTLGMSVAMLVIFLSENVFMYFIGACLVQFFVPHDMHVVYIMETAPKSKRATTYSVIKFFANMSVMLIPLLRDALMQTPSDWRRVFFIPALIGAVTCLIALIFARETDTFIDTRLAYLKKSDEERELEKADKKAQSSQGGLIPALKFAMKHKQLRWLYITTAVLNLGFIGTINYQVVLSYGYAEALTAGGAAESIRSALEAVSTDQVTRALFLFPVGCAVSQVIMGFLSDTFGRKKAAIVTAFNCLACFLLFWLGAKNAWNPYVAGFFCGAYIGSSYTTNDILIMMVGESAPTGLRSSVMSAQFVVTAIGVALSYIISTPLTALLTDSATGIVCLALTVPGYIAALVLLFRKTHDTKGIDLDSVTGTEWD